MSIVIEINSVDRSSDIEQDSVTLQQNMTKEPALLYFSIKGEKTMPLLGQSVVLTEDSVDLFKGVIVERREQVIGKLVVAYDYVCMDDTHNLDARLVSKAYNDTTAGAVVADIISSFTTGFTLDIPGTTPSVKSVRFNYEQPSRALQKIANEIGWDWYVDPADVVHFFAPTEEAPAITITDDSGNFVFNSLRFDRNIIELRNVIYVRGGEYLDPISEADAQDKYLADGEQVAFPLVYRYNNVQATLDDVPLTIGVDYIDDPTGFDVLYNFQEKLLKWPEASKPTTGQVVKVFGNAYVPLIVLAEDTDSIIAYGRREGIEINKNINSVEEAELLAFSLIDKWRTGSHEGTFQTSQTGLRVGQNVLINSTKFGVNETYKINRIRGQMDGHDRFIYDVQFIKSGQTTLTDMLIDLIGKERENIVISDQEVVQRVRNLTDTFGMTDEIVEVVKTSPPYVWDGDIPMEVEEDLITTEDTYYGTAFNQGPNPSSTTLGFGGWGDEYHSYLKFDLSTLPTNPDDVTEVLLFMYVGGPSTNDPVAQVMRVTEDWDDSTLSASLVPNDDNTNWGSLPTLAGGSPRWVSVDITNLVKAWVDGTYPNYGLKIHSTVTNNANNGSFQSREGANQPYIHATYNGVGSPSNPIRWNFFTWA